jgi:hypothetical protein
MPEDADDDRPGLPGPGAALAPEDAMIRRGVFVADYRTTHARLMPAPPAGAAAGASILVLLSMLTALFGVPDGPDQLPWLWGVHLGAVLAVFVTQFIVICVTRYA